MKFEDLAPDVRMFIGDDYASVATAFIDGTDVLLVDALASIEDGQRLRQVLCGEMGKTVRIIAATHFMSDHIAGMSLFPDALTIAHRHHRHAYLSQNRRMDAFYRDPQLVFDTGMTLRWGRYELHFVHNPGKTMDHVSVDVPGADLVCAGDNIVGNIVYLSKADPALIRSAIDRMRRFDRGMVVGGHIGSFPGAVLDHAIHYLDRMQEVVSGIRARTRDQDVNARIKAIPIEQCLAQGVQPTGFERTWHGNNLDVIIGQSIFSLDAALVSRECRA